MISIAQQTAAAARDLVLAKLSRVMKMVVKLSPDGQLLRLPPDRQHAMRILEAARRRWIREYNAHFGDGKIRERAIMELSLKSQDRGDLLKFCAGNHGIGRLDCTACDYEYVEFGGMPVQEPMNYVCPECKGGVVHVKTVPTWPEGTVIDPIEGTDVKPTMLRRYLCDNCGDHSEVEVKDESQSG